MNITFPDILFSVAQGVHALRVKDERSAVGIIYLAKVVDAIIVFTDFRSERRKRRPEKLILAGAVCRKCWIARHRPDEVIEVQSAEELGGALSPAETAEMEFRSDLTVALVKIIKLGKLTHSEIAERAGTSHPSDHHRQWERAWHLKGCVDSRACRNRASSRAEGKKNSSVVFVVMSQNSSPGSFGHKSSKAALHAENGPENPAQALF